GSSKRHDLAPVRPEISPFVDLLPSAFANLDLRDDRPLRNHSVLHVVPEINEKLASQGHEPDSTQSGSTLGEPLSVPAGECTARLVAKPDPADLDHHPPYPCVA